MKRLKHCIKLLTATLLASAGFLGETWAAPGTTVNVNFALTGAGDAMNGTPFISSSYQQAPAYYPGTTWNDLVGPTVIASNSEPGSSVSLTDALDSNGVATAIDFTTASTTTPFDLEGPYTFADHPNTRMLNGGVRRVWNSGSGNALHNRLTISGLDPLKVYHVYLASSQTPGVKCSWRIGAGGTDQLIRNTTATRTSETWKPGDNWTAFYSVAPNGGGAIDIQGKGDAGGDAAAFSGLTLNGFQIIEATGWLSPDKAIYDFGDPANNPGTSSVISENGTGNNLTWTVLFSSNLAALSPTFSLANGATCSPVSGSTQDFSGGPVNYTVTAQDGSTRIYAVTAVKAPASTTADILTLTSGAFSSTISGNNVVLTVVSGTSVNPLTPTITVSPFATISPASDVPQDFTTPVAYTVTAEDGVTTKNYTVTVLAANYWITAANGNWSDGPGTNWNPAVSPTSAATTALVFNTAGTYTSTHDLGDGFQMNQLTLGAAVTLSGNSMNLLSNGALPPTINQNSASTARINNNLDLGANMTFGGSGTGQVDLHGLISGAGGLTKNGSGRLTIVNTGNSFTGDTIINSGTLYMEVLSKLGDGTGSVTLNGGTLYLWRFNAANNLIVNGGTLLAENGFGNNWNGTITLNSTLNANVFYTLNCTNTISGVGGVNKTSGGPMNISGVASYTGPTTITAGTLTFSNAADQTLTGNVSGAGTLAKAGAGTLTLTGVTNYTGPITLTAGTLALDNAAAQTLSGAISGAGNLKQVGPGMLTLSAVNGYNGTTTVSGGTLNVTGSTLISSVFTVESGATLTGTGTIGGPTTLASGAFASFTLAPPYTNKLTFTSALNLNSNVVHLNLPPALPDGTYVLASYGSFTGAIDPNPVIDSGALANPGNPMLVSTIGGELILTVGFPPITILPATIAKGTTIAPYSAQLGATGGTGGPYTNFTIASGALPDGLTLSLSGEISGIPTTLGSYVFGVQVLDSSSTPAATAKIYTMDIVIPKTFAWANPATGNWSDPLLWTNNESVVAAPATAGQSDYTLNFNQAGTYTATQNLSAGFQLNKLNFGATSGTVTLAGTNGLTLVADGATLPSINQNSTAAIVVAPGLDLGSNLTFGGTGNGEVKLPGVLSGTGSLTKNGSGTLQITGTKNNTYSGGTVLNTGKLYLYDVQANDGLGSGDVTLNGGVFHLDRFALTNDLIVYGGSIILDNGFGSSMSGSITINAPILNLTAYYTNHPLSGAISGSGGITLSSLANGGVSLSGTNTYTGPTTVSGGTLRFDSINAVAGGDMLISAPGKVKLNFGSTKRINSLTLGGVLQVLPGTYGSTASGATYQNDTYFDVTGTGKVRLGGDSYDDWATLKGLTGPSGSATDPAKDADPDNDGNNNLYEFAFDGNPLSGANDGKIVAKIGTVGADQVLTLTLPVRGTATPSITPTFSVDSGDQLSALIDGIYYRIEGDENLSTFADAITEVTGGDAIAIQDGPPAVPTPAEGWVRRTFRVPGTVLTAPKAFLRAKVSETP